MQSCPTRVQRIQSQNKFGIVKIFTGPWTLSFIVPDGCPQGYPQLEIACVSNLKQLAQLRINTKCSSVLFPRIHYPPHFAIRIWSNPSSLSSPFPSCPSLKHAKGQDTFLCTSPGQQQRGSAHRRTEMRRAVPRSHGKTDRAEASLRVHLPKWEKTDLNPDKSGQSSCSQEIEPISVVRHRHHIPYPSATISKHSPVKAAYVLLFVWLVFFYFNKPHFIN